MYKQKRSIVLLSTFHFLILFRSFFKQIIIIGTFKALCFPPCVFHTLFACLNNRRVIIFRCYEFSITYLISLQPWKIFSTHNVYTVCTVIGLVCNKPRSYSRWSSKALDISTGQYFFCFTRILIIVLYDIKKYISIFLCSYCDQSDICDHISMFFLVGKGVSSSQHTHNQLQWTLHRN